MNPLGNLLIHPVNQKSECNLLAIQLFPNWFNLKTKSRVGPDAGNSFDTSKMLQMMEEVVSHVNCKADPLQVAVVHLVLE
jgi:hypothetical protein